MTKKLLISLSIIAVLASAAIAQKVYTPEKGSADRTSILSALRVPVEKELKQKINFNVDKFSVQGNWAFVSGEPQDAKGDKPNYKNTPYQQAVEEEMFDNNFFALLKKTGKNWKVVTYAIGCTDVCYLDWWKTYKAPKTIFPYSE